MKKRLLCLLILLSLIPTILIFAQDSATPTLEITGANPSDFPILTITTNILDNNNLPIEGLTRENFTLGGDLEGLATITQVENISADDLPFASVLVIDVSTSMSGLPLELAKQAASLFVQAVGDDDPIAIVTFANSARLIQDYTTDKDQLLAVIDGLQVSGRTALYDAAVLGVEVAAESPVSRRAVVLLSDGAEFGGESVNLREGGLETATRDGVSVFTIGLGFGTDRSYLDQLATGTNARFIESPTPDELTTIYAELAALFRTQYIITLESDLPSDGTTYEFTLQADTPEGTTNTDSGTIRAPIPVPIVTLDESLFAVPFSTPVTIRPDIVADDEVTDITVTIDGEAITLADNGSFVIDPVDYLPASYELTVTATDEDGDSGSATATFETAVLASDIEIDFAPDTEITEPTTLTISADGQTPAVLASYAILQEGTSITSEETTDAEASFPFTIDPFDFEVGDYELFVGVENEGGATANVTVPFSIASVPPRNIALEGIETDTVIESDTLLLPIADTQAGTNITESRVSINGDDLPDDNTIINPMAFEAGTLNVEVTIIDSNGNNTTSTIPVQIAALPPIITLGTLPDPITEDTELSVEIQSQTEATVVTYRFDFLEGTALEALDDGTYPAIPIELANLENGESIIVVEARDGNDLTNTAELIFTVELPATPTPTPDQALTAEAAIAFATADAVATLDAQSTSDAQATSDIQATLDVQSTSDAQATSEAQTAFDAQSTSDAQATNESQLALDAQSTSDAQATSEAQLALDAQSTSDAQATNESQLALDAQSTSDAQATSEAHTALDAQSTSDAQATNVAQATLDVQNTADAQTTGVAVATNNAATLAAEEATTEAIATEQAQATSDAQATEQESINLTASAEAEADANAQATVDAQSTLDVEATDVANTEVASNVVASEIATETLVPTETATTISEPISTVPLPTLTPVEILDVGAQSAENPPAEGSLTGLYIGAGALVMAIILLGILWFGRSREERDGGS